MIKYLLSRLAHYHLENEERIPNEIDDVNNIMTELKQDLKSTNSIVYIASDANNYEDTDIHSQSLFEALKLSGITFHNYYILDDRNKVRAKELILNASLVFLCGGDTYTQSLLLSEINLKDILKEYNGIVLGQSAGALNMAENVFSAPEEIIWAKPTKFTGLGLTNINIEPHFILDESVLDADRLNERKCVIEESYNRDIYALEDKSHIRINGDEVTLHGNIYLIKKGEITKVCETGKIIKL